MMLSSDMLKEEGYPQRRKVRCPCCHGLLLEPPGVEVYECPNCTTSLKAKGTTSSTSKTLLGQSSYERNGETPGQDPLKNGQTQKHIPKHESISQQGQTSQTDVSETVVASENVNEDTKLRHSSGMSVATMNEKSLESLDLIGIDDEAKGMTSNPQKTLLEQSSYVLNGGTQEQDPLKNGQTQVHSIKHKSIIQPVQTSQTDLGETVLALENSKKDLKVQQPSAFSVATMNEGRLAKLDSSGIDDEAKGTTSMTQNSVLEQSPHELNGGTSGQDTLTDDETSERILKHESIGHQGQTTQTKSSETSLTTETLKEDSKTQHPPVMSVATMNEERLATQDLIQIDNEAKGTTFNSQENLVEQSSFELNGGTPGQVWLKNGPSHKHIPKHESISQQGQTSQTNLSETVLALENAKEYSKLRHPSTMSVANINEGRLASFNSIGFSDEGTNCNTQKKLLQQRSNELNGQTQGYVLLINNDGREDHIPEDDSIRQHGQTLQKIKEMETLSIPEILVKQDSTPEHYSAMSDTTISEEKLISLDLFDIQEEVMGARVHNSLNITSKVSGHAKEGALSEEGVIQLNHVDEQPEAPLWHPNGILGGKPIGSDCDNVERMMGGNGKTEGILGIGRGMATACSERNNVSCNLTGVEEPYYESNTSNEKNDIQFDAQIIRDNDNELSFKYITSIPNSNVPPDGTKTVHQLAKMPLEVSRGKFEMRTRHSLSLELPFSNERGSIDYESYLSYSDSHSHGESDSEFDFPAPLADSIHATKLSDSCFESHLSKIPHRLEWQYADADNYGAITRHQESNSSIVSDIEIVGKIASAVEAQAEPGGKENVDHGLPITYTLQCDNFPGMEGLTKEKSAENDILVSSTISVLHECDGEVHLADSINNCNKETCSKAKDELLESTRADADQILQLKPKSFLRADSQPYSTEPSTSTSSTRQMEVCSTVEDAKLIKIGSTPALTASASRQHDNVVDNLVVVKKEDELAALHDVPCGGDTENDYSDVRKGLKGQMSYMSEQVRVSQNGSRSEWHYAWGHSHEEGHLQTRVEVSGVSDAKQRRKRNNLSYAEQSLSCQDAATLENQENIQGDLYPPAQMTLEDSFRIHEGSSFHAQDSHGDLYKVEHTINNADASNFFPASSYSYGSNASFDGSRSFGNTACSCQAPACPYMLPVPMHGVPYSHDVCHGVCQVCVPHFRDQDFVLPSLPVPSCLHCLRTMAHYQGHPDARHYHRGFQAKGLGSHSAKFYCPQIAHMHDSSLTIRKASKPSVSKPKKYPPLPQERMAPYVVCRRCNDILEVPVCYSSGGRVQKLRCGACGTVSKFSVSKNTLKCHAAGLQSSAEGTTSRSTPPPFEFITKRREKSIVDLSQRIESSSGRSFLAQNKRGSVSLRHLSGGHHNLQSELKFEVKPSQDAYDAKLPTSRNSHSSQDEFFFKTLSRKSEFGSSGTLFSGFKTSRFGVNNAAHEELVDDSLQCAVDEQEEGLAFGAPRPSDGDSLDQRSPENFDSLVEPMHTSSFREEDWVSEIEPEFQSERKTTDQMRSRLTLYALFNQESTKFRITMENGDLLEESASGSWSPTKRSAVHKATNKKPELAPINLRTEQFIKKGPRQIAAMLTRSWKHQVRN